MTTAATTVAQWGWVEYGLIVIGGFLTLIGALLTIIWSQLNEKIKTSVSICMEKMASVDGKINVASDRTNRQFSDINNLRVELAELKTKVENHTDKFDELVDSIGSLREELNGHLRRIEDKIDGFRERRGS